MPKTRTLVIGLAGAAGVGALVWALWPQPVAVDLVEVARAPMEVTVSGNGVTRIRDTWLVTAPIAGTAARAPVEVGDAVERGETVVATIEPAPPALLDARTRAQSEAAVVEAEAALRHAETNVTRAQTDVDFAASQFERFRELAQRGTIPSRMVEESQLQLRTAESALQAALSDVERQRAALQRARAQLVEPNGSGPRDEPGACCVVIRAPASGVVLSIEQISARPVQPGQPLMTLGRPDDLEIEVELLSSDAVRIRAGAEARVSRWGGEGDLPARVRLIEPSAQTRVSALGIEEQRVRVMLDLLAPPEARPGLGNNFRVFVSVVEWAGADVPQVPISALFRQGEDWAVYRVVEGRAEPARIQIGRRTGLMAEVLAGLAEGDRVIAYPGERITPGARVTDRGRN